MGFFLVLKAELVRTMIITRRYWFATLMALIVGCTMFSGMIYLFLKGAVSASNLAVAGTEKGLGLVIGIFAFSIVGMFSNGLASMARSGELEQVYMSPHGLITNFLARSTVSTIMAIITWTILLAFVSTTFAKASVSAATTTPVTAPSTNVAEATPAVAAPAAEAAKIAHVPGEPLAAPDGKLHAEPLPTAVLLFLTYFNMIGFGFMIGGLVLVFKQIGNIAVIIRFIMMGIAWSASDGLYEQHLVLQWIGHLVPVTDAAICLKLVVLRDYGSHIFTHPSFYFLIGNVTLWTPIGFICFKAMENWARSKGTLGAF